MLALLLAAADTAAQPHLFFPRPHAAWDWDAGAGLTLLTVPRDISEEELNKAPALDLHGALGLPLQFEVTGRITAQYLTNQFQFGPRWSHSFGRFGIAAGYDVAWWFGFIDLEGFDNSAAGWMNYPSLSVGYDLDGVLITLKGEAFYLMFQRSYAGEDEVGSDKNVLNGYGVSLLLEQPFFRNTHVLAGARVSATGFHYQTWFAFSAFKRRLVYSELMFAIIF